MPRQSRRTIKSKPSKPNETVHLERQVKINGRLKEGSAKRTYEGGYYTNTSFELSNEDMQAHQGSCCQYCQNDYVRRPHSTDFGDNSELYKTNHNSFRQKVNTINTGACNTFPYSKEDERSQSRNAIQLASRPHTPPSKALNQRSNVLNAAKTKFKVNPDNKVSNKLPLSRGRGTESYQFRQKIQTKDSDKKFSYSNPCIYPTSTTNQMGLRKMPKEIKVLKVI